MDNKASKISGFLDGAEVNALRHLTGRFEFPRNYRALLKNSQGAADQSAEMDHKKKKKALILSTVLFAASAAGAGYFFSHGKAKHEEHAKAEHGEQEEGSEPEENGEHPAPKTEAHASYFSPSYWFHRYGGAVVSFQEKVDELKRADETAHRLELENANLRLRVETLQLGCHAEFAERKTKNIESTLTKDTGTKIGRTLATIAYKPPTNLFPDQLYTLAVSYFKSHDDEKAAVILTYLTNLEQTDKFKTAQNLVMTGVAWYRVDNLEMADLYFGRALELPAGGQNLKSQAHARLWRGLVAKHEGKQAVSQKWLRELLDHHPQSVEASWVNNSKEGIKRDTASVHSED